MFKKTVKVDVGDEEQVEKRRSNHKTDRDQELENIRSVLATKSGREFFWRILSRSGLFKTSFTGDNTTFFKEGERNMGLWILKEIQVGSPGAFEKMQSEMNNKGEQND